MDFVIVATCHHEEQCEEDTRRHLKPCLLCIRGGSLADRRVAGHALCDEAGTRHREDRFPSSDTTCGKQAAPARRLR